MEDESHLVFWTRVLHPELQSVSTVWVRRVEMHVQFARICHALPDAVQGHPRGQS